LFENGIDFDVKKLYPSVNFPVSRGTPMIAPLIKWDHSQSYNCFNFEERVPAEDFTIINLNDPEFSYISGHEIDGRILFPATGYLYLVWRDFAFQSRKCFENLNVEFEDVKFLRATPCSNLDTELKVNIQMGTGRFEIKEKNEAVVVGYIHSIKDSKLSKIQDPDDNGYPILYNRDFYKELRLRGYNYKGLFRSVVDARADGLKGRVLWQNNWVAFLDCLLQVNLISKDTRSLMIPTEIRKIVIQPQDHFKEIAQIKRSEKIIKIQCSAYSNVTRCGGIEISGLKTKVISRRDTQVIPVIESQQFIPYYPSSNMSTLNVAKFCVQHALENMPCTKIVAVEIDSQDGKEPIIQHIGKAIDDLPLITSDLTYISAEKTETNGFKVSQDDVTTFLNNSFIIRSNCLRDEEFLKSVSTLLGDNGFVISRETNLIDPIEFKNPSRGFRLISLIRTKDEFVALIQYSKLYANKVEKVIQISMNDINFSWIKNLQDALKEGPVIAYAEQEEYNGIVGLVKCIQKEPNGHNLKCFFIDDDTAPKFDIDNPFYQQILSYNFTMNVYKNGKWGSFKHLTLDKTVKTSRYNSHCYVDHKMYGNSSSVQWFNNPKNCQISDENVVRIHYAGLNAKDMIIASGKSPANCYGNITLDRQNLLGCEFTGVTNTGIQIMGIANGGCLSTHTTLNNLLYWKVPKNWTLEDAATVPFDYLTVYYAFFIASKIEKGKSILIHASLGSVAIAAIRVAFAYGLEVFTTFTEEERNIVCSEFPQLKKENIFNALDESFEEVVMKKTDGRGVDYVLCSSLGDTLKATVRCLGSRGVYLQIGKFDESKLELRDFLREFTFHSITIEKLFEKFNEDFAVKH
jgi:fatty acid synthase, animal type